MKVHRWELRNEGAAHSSASYECTGCGWWKFVTQGVDGEEVTCEPPEGLGREGDGDLPDDCNEAIVKSMLDA